jgi:hypothetical protein
VVGADSLFADEHGISIPCFGRTSITIAPKTE